MMKDFAIKAEGLSKEYHIYDTPGERLKELFLKTKKHRVFRAFGPLDIVIPKGEMLGIVGENGAGKSTFLKLVAGVTEPSSGRVTVNGKISSILELGTGFNPEFTGRENVVLNGALLGLSSPGIARRMEKIKQFADIGEFFDMPVKMYSSGMYLRLAFSLAVHVDADIIVIDEALSVGDGIFEKRCIDRIWDLKRNGITMLYCSHSLYTVAQFCDRTVWLKEGRMERIGEPKEVISVYEDYLREKSRVEEPKMPAGCTTTEKKVAAITNVRLTSDGQPADSAVPHLSDVNIIVDFEIFESMDVYAGIGIERNDGLCCFADSMLKQGIKGFRGPGSEHLTVSFSRFPLLGGEYKFVVFLLDETGVCIFDRKDSVVFKVETTEKEWGVCYLQHEWKK
jgi:ABC-type polysaccharide/polyol phosphate transport system ATPase subunit